MRVFLPLLGLVILGACHSEHHDESPDAGPGSGESFDRKAAAVTVVTGAVLPYQSAFVSSLNDLKTAVDSRDLDASKAAWGASMDAWQRLEALQFGPAGKADDYAGGEGWGEEIHSWPLTNTCAIERAYVDQSEKNPDWFDAKLVSIYGLDALEYVLYNAPTETTCIALVGLQPEFDALGEEGLARSRWAYADAVVANLIADSSALNTAWQGYSAVIESAGTDGSAFDKERCPLDQVAAAMFYVDQQVKDAKLAIPGGLSPDCENDNCPERVEHPWANRSRESLIANLEGFHTAFEDGGLFAVLDEHSDEGATLATELRSSTEAAIQALQAETAPLAELVVSQPAKVEAIHTKVRAITTLFKSQLVSLLNLELPNEGLQDND
ncbi:MAG TPA: hypothetical protein DEB46_13785 [Myxococcales bacterium]|nr:hypothetical protein [Myxococcales bacterium]